MLHTEKCIQANPVSRYFLTGNACENRVAASVTRWANLLQLFKACGDNSLATFGASFEMRSKSSHFYLRKVLYTTFS